MKQKEEMREPPACSQHSLFEGMRVISRTRRRSDSRSLVPAQSTAPSARKRANDGDTPTGVRTRTTQLWSTVTERRETRQQQRRRTAHADKTCANKQQTAAHRSCRMPRMPRRPVRGGQLSAAPAPPHVVHGRVLLELCRRTRRECRQRGSVTSPCQRRQAFSCTTTVFSPSVPCPLLRPRLRRAARRDGQQTGGSDALLSKKRSRHCHRQTRDGESNTHTCAPLGSSLRCLPSPLSRSLPREQQRRGSVPRRTEG
jgi:hypothetical protein